jgi:hypothetical protein
MGALIPDIENAVETPTDELERELVGLWCLALENTVF